MPSRPPLTLRSKKILWGLAGLAALGLAALASSCVTATDAARRASFAPYVNARIGNEPTEAFLLARTAIVLSNARWVETPSAEQPKLGKLVPTDPASGFGIGIAAAIDRRGYFITAAHVVGADTPYLSYRINGPDTILPARIVWRGDASKGEADLAVIHVADRLDQVFGWAETVLPEAAVLATGVVPSTGKMAALAGTALRIEAQSGRPGITALTHNAPLRPGDSGGPAANTNGELLGITSIVFGHGYRRGNTIFRVPFTKMAATAIRPDRDWLRKVIDDDVAAQTKAAP